MKKFLQWFVSFLQILFGLAAFAVIGLYLLDKFDIASIKDNDYLTYVVYGCAGLFIVLSVITMAIALRARGKKGSLTVSGDKTFTVRISAGKIKELAKEAAAAVNGVKFKKLFIISKFTGYVLKLKIDVSFRNVKEASEEYKIIVGKLCEDIYGLVFADIDITVDKVKYNDNIEDVKKEAKAVMEAEAVKELASGGDYSLPPADDNIPQIEAASYSQPYMEDYGTGSSAIHTAPDEGPANTPSSAESAAADSVTILKVGETEPQNEPIIKTSTAVRTGPAIKAKTAAKTAAKAPAKTAAKTGAKSSAAAAKAKPVKQPINPADPPPFKL